jgi:hypothetical protein
MRILLVFKADGISIITAYANTAKPQVALFAG